MTNLIKPGSLVVIKLGSSILVNSSGRVEKAFIKDLAAQLAYLIKHKISVVLVSSGAVAAGLDCLGLTNRPSDIASLQACAASGQVALMQAYSEALKDFGIACGQVLLTRRDVMDRSGYLNARTTLMRLIELGVLPIVNENDTVSVAEFTFSDNDMLGAIVASLIGADLYLILSDVEGLYTQDPRTHPNASLLSHVEQINDDIVASATGAGSAFGTGGMSSKIVAARAVAAAGIPLLICKGRRPSILVDLADGKARGTYFEAKAATHESSRKLWIGLAELAHGTLVLDEGACTALRSQGASLLPVGITEVKGSFTEGDVVDVRASDQSLLARGIARYNSDDMRRVAGLHLDVIARFLPSKATTPAIHRDELLVF